MGTEPHIAVPKTTDVRSLASAAKAASRVLATLDEETRNRVLESMAKALKQGSESLLQANEWDLLDAALRTGEEVLSPSTLSRLKLSPARLEEMMAQVRSVAALPDPLRRVLDAVELDDADPKQFRRSEATGLHLRKVSVPLGVLAVIFEARPDAVTQIAALALKSGNAVILKPGREVEHTAAALVDALRGVLLSEGLPMDAISMVAGREQVSELLRAHDLIDMVIPRGSRQLVEYVQSNTRIPVLGHSEGVCHIYVDRATNAQLALRVIADAKLDYPAACNAVETVLVHREIAPKFVPSLVEDLLGRGVRLHATAELRALLSQNTAEAVEPVEDWHTEFGEAELAIGLVDSIEDAIAHIHRHGSSHTESILTEDPQAAEQFLREVDAAGVFLNVSTRFADGFRYGFGAEVGISTSKFHARGPVGLDGLTTYKYVLRGHGQIAADYRGPDARTFTHRRELP